MRETVPGIDPSKEEKQQAALKYLVDNLGKPGFAPEDVAFFIQHPEFEHRPVGIREFITSPLYLDAKDECWPCVLEDLEEVFPEDLVGTLRLSRFIEVVRDLGIGSGKSKRVGYMFAYVAFRLLCFKDPQREYGLSPGTKIALINSSITAPQSKKVVFGDVVASVKNSPWFQQHAPHDPNVHSELRFPKDILVFPASSSETAPLGYSVFFFNIDEAAYFTATDARDSAQEIFDGMNNRRVSRFGDNGLGSMISSPRYVDDFIERKCDEARTNPQVSGKRGATWESRPDDIAMIERGKCFTLRHPRTSEEVRIPNKYAASFRRNPAKAWRDFGAVASLALEPYFADDEIEKLERLMRQRGRARPPDELRPEPGAVYFAHFDLGVVRDACGFVMVHRDGRMVRVDCALRIVSERRAREMDAVGQAYDVVLGREQVPIAQVREIVYCLAARGFSFGRVTYDQFQSLESRQELEASGIPAGLLSVDKDTSAYDTVKDLLNSDRLDPCEHEVLLLECRRLELRKGKKVDHPDRGTKDVADGLAGACKSAAEWLDEPSEQEHVVVEDEEYRQEITPPI